MFDSSVTTMFDSVFDSTATGLVDSFASSMFDSSTGLNVQFNVDIYLTPQ